MTEVGNTILIVEDNEHLQRILSAVIQFLGYRTIVAETGAQAIEKAVSAKPNLILLDLDLPDTTGHNVARSIKKNPLCAHIPIIGCSAFHTGDDKEKALRAGMVDYLQKPVPSEVFRQKIKEFIAT